MVEWIYSVCYQKVSLGFDSGQVDSKSVKLVFTASLLDVEQYLRNWAKPPPCVVDWWAGAAWIEATWRIKCNNNDTPSICPIKSVEYAWPQKTLQHKQAFFFNALLFFSARLFLPTQWRVYGPVNLISFNSYNTYCITLDIEIPNLFTTIYNIVKNLKIYCTAFSVWV